MISFRLPWPPTDNHYYTVARGRKILSKRGRKYKKQVAEELLLQQAPKDLKGRLEIHVDAYPPDRRKRDLFNICKALFDSIQGYGMFDDEQIDDGRLRRMELGGFVVVRITEVTDLYFGREN